MTTPRPRGTLLALLVGGLCGALAGPAVAEKRPGVSGVPAGATSPSPTGVELGVGDGRLESFARALHGLASNMAGSASGWRGGPLHTTYTSETNQLVCGFKVTGRVEQLDASPHHTQPVTDPNDPTKIVTPSFKTGHVREETLRIQIEVPPERLNATERSERSFLLKFTTHESTRGEEKPKGSAARKGATPNTSLHFEVKSQNFGMDALIDHAKKSGCSVEETWRGGRARTLIRMPKAGK